MSGRDDAVGTAMGTAKVTPHRFVFWFPPQDVGAAGNLLEARNEAMGRRIPPREDGLAGLEVTTTTSPRSTALRSVLITWKRVQLVPAAFDAKDVLTEVSRPWLVEQLRGWCKPGPGDEKDAYRRRLEAVGGSDVVGELLAIIDDPASSHELRGAAGWTCEHAVINGPERALCERLLRRAVEGAREMKARTVYPKHTYVRYLIEAVGEATRLQAFGLGAEVDDQLLLPLIAHPNYIDVVWPATRAMSALTSVRSPEATSVLVELTRLYASRSSESWFEATDELLRCMAHCPDTTEVREVLDELCGDPRSRIRIGAVWNLAEVAGASTTRAHWQRMASSSVTQERVNAGRVIVHHGDEADIPAAVTLLNAALKSKSPSRWDDPPWGCDLIGFLWRYRSVSEPARTAVADVRSRAERLHPDVKQWLDKNLSDVLDT